jgi:hypothetical protein
VAEPPTPVTVVESFAATESHPQLIDIFGQSEYAAYRNQLFHRSNSDGPWQKLSAIAGLEEIQQVLEVRQGLVFVYGAKRDDHFIYAVSDQTTQLVYEFRPGVLILRRGWMVSGDGTVFIGEYTVTPRNTVPYVNVLQSTDGLHFEPIKEFPRGTQGIRHIHFIQEDPYDPGVFYLGTGDSPTESRLFVSRDLGVNWVELSRGHSVIAVSLGFTAKYVYWGTDTPYEQTWIYRMNKQTRVIEQLQAVSGTVYWTQVLKTGAVAVFTTVEPQSRWDSQARIYLSTDGVTFQEVFAMESNGQGYGRLNPTRELTDGSLYVQCSGLKECSRGYLHIKFNSITGRQGKDVSH